MQFVSKATYFNSISFLLVHKKTSHLHSMEVRMAEVAHCQGSLAFRIFLIVRDDQRRALLHTFQRWHSAEEFSFYFVSFGFVSW